MVRLLILLLVFFAIAFVLGTPVEACHKSTHRCPTPLPTAPMTPTVAPTRAPTPGPTATPVVGCIQVQSLTLQSSQSYNNYCISNTTGACVTGVAVSNVVISNFKVGPCGGSGIFLYQSAGVTIQDSAIFTGHSASGCCDTYDGVLTQFADRITIQRNTISRSETNIELQFTTNSQVLSNTLLDPLGPFPRGNQIQIVGRPYGAPSTDVLVQGNTLRSSAPDACPGQTNPCGTTDHISIAGSDRITVRSNDVRGYAPGAVDSACQIIADFYNTQVLIEANFASGLPGVGGTQCGMSNANGQNVTINNNESWDNSNQAFTVWNASWYAQYPPCFGIHVTNNRAPNAALYHSFWYDGTSCGVIEEAGNSWN